jgi:hypothetical protein
MVQIQKHPEVLYCCVLHLSLYNTDSLSLQNHLPHSSNSTHHKMFKKYTLSFHTDSYFIHSPFASISFLYFIYFLLFSYYFFGVLSAIAPLPLVTVSKTLKHWFNLLYKLPIILYAQILCMLYALFYDLVAFTL